MKKYKYINIFYKELPLYNIVPSFLIPSVRKVVATVALEENSGWDQFIAFMMEPGVRAPTVSCYAQRQW